MMSSRYGVSTRFLGSFSCVCRRLEVERLEDRLAPATFFWNGAGDGMTWSQGANWSGGVAPAMNTNDDVRIDPSFRGTTISSSGNVSIRSVTSYAALQITSGSFSLGSAPSELDNDLTVSAGTLNLTGTILNGTGTLSNQGRLVVHRTCSFAGAFTNGPTGTLSVEGLEAPSAILTMSQGFTNAGTIELVAHGNTHAQLNVSSGTLTNTGAGASRTVAEFRRSARIC